ncbi:MAG: succinylglutamate desuccinylase/aspartoacylase family protein [Pseudomonadota bacterium]
MVTWLEPHPPVELQAVDIEPYRAGNAGVEWVTTFFADRAGPHVAVTALVHGNEPCGAIALDWLFRRGVRPVRGRLSLAFLNVDAYRAFDPAAPNLSRWSDEDFNRIWDATILDGPRTSVELQRARAIRTWIDDVDLLLDVHSMQHTSPPLMLAGTRPRATDLAIRVGTPSIVVQDAGHAAGPRLRDYGEFGAVPGGRTALLAECGQHWAAATAELAIESVVRFLRATAVVASDFAADRVPLATPPIQMVVQVTEAVTIREPDFRFVAPYKGMEVIPRAGSVIGWEGTRPVTTPYDDCILIMPSRRLWPGQTAVRLGRRIG